MAKTQGAKSSSPSNRLRAPRETPVQGSIPEPPQSLVMPPPIEDAPLSSPTRRYGMRWPPTTPGASSSRAKKSGSHPSKKKAKPGAPVGPEHPKIPHPEHPEEPQPVEIPVDMRAPAPAVPFIEPIPEIAPSAPPATLGTPPVIPSTSEPFSPHESRIAISISEFRGLCHTLQTLTTSQSILTQQMTALRAHQE
ncbi:cornifin-A-like [Vitis riparia]|uniref:cornifin-A-like n=1 Tax=Vitis riparia TaxID=96939 RepID=UPI00155A5DE1|nr:cornifin-A-like [Vitis riparia]